MSAASKEKSKRSRLSKVPISSHKAMPMRSKMMRSVVNKNGGNNSRSGSRSKLESRFLSRMKSSMIGGKYKSGYKKKGSSKYTAVRENGDPIIWREGTDVTPLPLQIDNIQVPVASHTYDTVQNNDIENVLKNCFVPLTEKIYHPMDIDDNTNNNVHGNNTNEQVTDEIEHKNNSKNNNNNNNKQHPSVTITKQSDIKEGNINKGLEDIVQVYLSESDTMFLFEMPSLAISNRDESKEEREKVIAQNKEYDFVVMKHSDKDLFTSSTTQTYNAPVKERGIEVIPPTTNEQQTQCSKFDIYDAFHDAIENNVNNPNNQKMMNNSSRNSYNSSSANGAGLSVDMNQEILAKMESSKSFQTNLSIMERAIIQNFMAEQQMLYRLSVGDNANESMNTMDDNDNGLLFDDINGMSENLNDTMNDNDHDNNHDSNTKGSSLKVHIDLQPIDPEKQKEINEIDKMNKAKTKASNMSSNMANLQLLWTYSIPNNADPLPCTALDYNPLFPDMTVAGYGSWNFLNKSKGKIMFWTLKNNVCPSRTYELPDTCVMSLNFSRVHPYLLAAGLYDGCVAVYDVRSSALTPSLQSSFSCKHSQPVWNVQWAKKAINNNGNGNNDYDKNNDQNVDQRHSLFSISSDGLIKQWSMKKGFISSNIMSLKRNSIRSRQASGLCFDFDPSSNSTQYLVGTEDGIVHKCSVSYNEQVLRTYNGHSQPVHRILCSPFDYDKFMTCSADWTTKIWQKSQSKPLIDLYQNNNQSVIDCCWSPTDSCVFATATENGSLSIWDLQKSKKDPICTTNTKVPIKQIMFAPNANAILAAQTNGNIQVLRLNNIYKKNGNMNNYNQIQKLNKALLADN